jgi:hypothetical protein
MFEPEAESMPAELRAQRQQERLRALLARRLATSQVTGRLVIRGVNVYPSEVQRVLPGGTGPRTEVGKAVRVAPWADAEPPVPGLD